MRPTGPTLGGLARGEWVVLRGPQGEERREQVVATAGDGDHPILTFAGLGDREAAGSVAGFEIHVSAERVPALDDPHTFYVRDLIGCSVSSGGNELGRVVDVLQRPANDALEIQGPSGSLLVPLTDDALEEIDLTRRRVSVRADLLAGMGG